MNAADIHLLHVTVTFDESFDKFYHIRFTENANNLICVIPKQSFIPQIASRNKSNLKYW